VKVVLADSHEVFRAGIAKTISIKDDYRIVAQCSNPTRLLQAISAFPGCVAIVATCLRIDLNELRSCLERTASRAIAVVEQGEIARHSSKTFLGVVSRDVTPAALLDCVRRVALGYSWIAAELKDCMSAREDMVGMSVRDRLTPREMRIAAMLLQGRKNREISLRLGTTEQVIKNCFRSIYEKSGVGDRLELVVFIHKHESLVRAVAAVARAIKAEELSAAYSTAVA
jgi:DNA-binding NarL/FixJ family response regulator